MTSAEPLAGEVMDPETVTETCPECGDQFTGPTGGQNNAAMLLGRHRWGKHRVKSDGTRQRTPAGKSRPNLAEPVDVSDARHPVLTTVSEAASLVPGKGAPSAASLAKAFGYGLSAASKSAARWAVDSDPVIRGSDDPAAPAMREAMVAGLAISRADAQTIMAPLARIFAPTELNKRVGRTVVEHSDVGPAVAALIDVGRQWGEFLAIRREHLRLLRELRDAQAAGAMGGAPPTPPADVPPVPTPPIPTPTPPAPAGPLGGGRIATPTYRTA